VGNVEKAEKENFIVDEKPPRPESGKIRYYFEILSQ